MTVDPPRARFTHDGYPANLPAAAWDALIWLSAFSELPSIRKCFKNPVEDTARLARCCSALEDFLSPCLPPTYDEAPKQFPEAVAQIVGYSLQEEEEEPDREQQTTK